MSTHDQGTEGPYEYDVDDPEVRLAEKLEHLRVSQSLEMVRLRKDKGLTQEQMGERLGIGQPQISKLENPDIESSLENIARYLDAVDAELAVGIRTDAELVQASDDEEYELFAHPNRPPSMEHESVVQFPVEKSNAEQPGSANKFQGETDAPKNPDHDFPRRA
ncbi:MAG: helix-turn-helix domain-containing protein [Bradymonadaceae bacterium]